MSDNKNTVWPSATHAKMLPATMPPEAAMTVNGTLIGESLSFPRGGGHRA